MSDIVVERVRTRGVHARRLASIASTTLPLALERALCDLGDIRLPTLAVPLDFDPTLYDDETVATMWAERVRSAALASGAAPREPHGALPAGTEPAEASAAQSTARREHELGAALRAWLSAGFPLAAVPRAFAVEWSTAEWAAALSLLTPVELAALRRTAASLRTAFPSAPGAPPSDLTSSDLAPAGLTPAGAADPRIVPAPSSSPSGSSLDLPTTTAPEPHEAQAAAVELELLGRHLAGLADLTSPSAQAIDITLVSSAGGLVLLYPWLAAYCEDACLVLPEHDAAQVRAGALSVLATGDLVAVTDPLVVNLAGLDREHGPLDHDALAPLLDPPERAEAVLHRFAALLPGFSESTPEFVRAQWIERRALFDPDAGSVTVETAPLDVLLPALPYPLTGFRLPWTEVLLVRFTP